MINICIYIFCQPSLSLVALFSFWISRPITIGVPENSLESYSSRNNLQVLQILMAPECLSCFRNLDCKVSYLNHNLYILVPFFVIIIFFVSSVISAIFVIVMMPRICFWFFFIEKEIESKRREFRTLKVSIMWLK